MSKFLKIFIPAGVGTAGMLALAYTLANQFVVEFPAPLGMEIVGAAEAQETAGTADDAVETEVIVTEMAPASDGGFGLGREALPEEVAAWDIDIRPDGLGLPSGSGDVFTGEELYIEKCAACHGDFGEAVGRWPQLAGGFGSLQMDDPVKTVGSYWPYLSTVFDYVHRAMPFGEAQSLEPDEVYAITAYLLYLNDIVADDFTLSNENFLDVAMSNASNFIDDDRATTELEQFSVAPCMTDCKETVEITMRAAILDVTPDDGTDDGETGTTPVEAAVDEVPEGQTVEAGSEEVAPVEAETADASAGDPVASETLDPLLVAEGEKVFRRCASCHQIGPDAENRSGPVLTGIVGNAAGLVEGFRYSDAITGAGEGGLIWTNETLAEYLADPRGYIPNNRMSFAGLRTDEEIAAVIAYLQSFGN